MKNLKDGADSADREKSVAPIAGSSPVRPHEREESFTVAFIRFTVTLPILAILFAASNLPLLTICSAEGFPSLSAELAALQPFSSQIQAACAIFLMLLNFPIYRQGIAALFTRVRCEIGDHILISISDNICAI